MKIYQVVPNPNIYDSLYCVDSKDYRIIRHFLGYCTYDKAPKSWHPITVAIDPETKSGDFPYLSACLVLNISALKILKTLIEKSVEFLPLQCDSGQFVMLKIVDVVDCLDLSRAEVRRFPSSGRVMDVLSYAFKKGSLENKIIFKIPEQRSSVYVSQKFKDCVENNKLEGLIFEEIYSE